MRILHIGAADVAHRLRIDLVHIVTRRERITRINRARRQLASSAMTDIRLQVSARRRIVELFLASNAHICFAPSMILMLLIHAVACAFCRELTKFGMAMAANIPMIATTIMISTSVNPATLFFLVCMGLL
jgi:hypothetical protein